MQSQFSGLGYRLPNSAASLVSCSSIGPCALRSGQFGHQVGVFASGLNGPCAQEFSALCVRQSFAGRCRRKKRRIARFKNNPDATCQARDSGSERKRVADSLMKPLRGDLQGVHPERGRSCHRLMAGRVVANRPTPGHVRQVEPINQRDRNNLSILARF